MDKSELNTADCEIIVKKVLNSDDVSVVNFILLPVQNQNSELKIIFLHKSKEESLNFFVKSSLNIPKINDIFTDFKKILPNFDPKFTPTLYYAKEGFLIFEDLTSQGFCVQTGFFQKTHLIPALRALAKFHAASFAFEEIKSKNNRNFKLDEEYALLHINFLLKKPEVAKLISDVIQDEDRGAQLIEDLEKRQFSSRFRRTLCHGNLLSKNILFNVEECKLINLKSNFYAPPIYDVLQVIFFNTNEDLRQRSLQTLLLCYYGFLKEGLEDYGLNIDEIFPRRDLDVSVHHFLPLIKLENALLRKKRNEDKVVVEEAIKELKEVLTYPLLSKEDCYVIVKNKIGTADYDFLSFEITPLSDVSGFLGEYHKLQIKVRYLSNGKTINCFIKCPPKTTIAEAISRDVESFSREIFMYQILVPQMQKLGIEIINDCVPPCYLQRHDEFIVFEDMSLLNYRNLDALKPLDFTLLAMLVRKLAKFHACSLIFEEKQSQNSPKPYRLVENYREYFNEPLFFEDEHHLGARSFMTGIKSILAAVDLFSEIKTEKNQHNFKKCWPKFKELFYSVVKTSDRFRNVLSHGDLWTSNMLVLKEDKTIDCVLIDFQIVRYCPPAYDLLSVLHLTTDRSTRQKHEEELIGIYYEELGFVLDSYGYDVKTIYPYVDYLGCLQYLKPQMVMQAAIDCVLTMCTPEEISSFLTNDETCKYVYFEDRTEFLTSMCEKSSMYKTRLMECILDIYDYCDSMCEEQK